MTDHRIGLVRALLFGGSALVMLGACTLASRALGHDIYQGVRSPAGQLCCGGDPVTGDCEGSYDFRVNARGDVTFKWRPAAPKPAAVLAGCSGRAGESRNCLHQSRGGNTLVRATEELFIRECAPPSSQYWR